jgi:hypothetical protein
MRSEAFLIFVRKRADVVDGVAGRSVGALVAVYIPFLEALGW